MALKIRFRQQGRTNRQTFRLVVTDIRNPRDGKYLESLGSYNPFQAENNLKLKLERIEFWLNKGAQIAENAEKLIAKTAPELIKNMKAKQHAKRTKLAAKRRALKMKKKGAAPKEGTPAKTAKTDAKRTKKKDQS